MGRLNVNPTRMELGKLKIAYSSALRGHKLLKDKRDELMKRVLEMAREAREVRRYVEHELKISGKSLRTAGAQMGEKELKTALISVNTNREITVRTEKIMSVPLPVFEKTEAETEISYGFSHTTSELDIAVERICKLRGKLLRLAELEKAVELVGSELERVRRRVNALEHIMLPDYRETIRYISMKLEENERANSIRLLKVKDMVLYEAKK